MKTMGWSWQEYNSAPASLIEEIVMFMATEDKAIQGAEGVNHG
jgi:hypothetical protein